MKIKFIIMSLILGIPALSQASSRLSYEDSRSSFDDSRPSFSSQQASSEIILTLKDPATLTKDEEVQIEETFVGAFLKAYEKHPEEELGLSKPKKLWLVDVNKEDLEEAKTSSKGIKLLVAIKEGKIVARSTAEVQEEERGKKVLYIRQLAVHPLYQKQGIGSMLMGWYEQQYNDVNAIVLVTRVVNEEAKGFYTNKKLGFTQGGYTHPEYSLERYTGYRKNLF